MPREASFRMAERYLVLTHSLLEAVRVHDQEGVQNLMAERANCLAELSQSGIDAESRDLLERAQEAERKVIATLQGQKGEISAAMVQLFHEKRGARRYEPAGRAAGLDQRG